MIKTLASLVFSALFLAGCTVQPVYTVIPYNEPVVVSAPVIYAPIYRPYIYRCFRCY